MSGEGLLDALGGAFLLYSLVIVAQYAWLAAVASVEVYRQRRAHRIADRLSLFDDDLAPPISLLVPAFNEAPTIAETVRSLMQLRYPSLEIIVVNDGSTDHTLAAMIEAFGLLPSARTLRARVPRERIRGVYSAPRYPYLVLLDVENGGKAAALNLALAFSRHPLICTIDADSVLERDTLLQLALPFYHDPTTLAVGGVVRPANGCVIRGGRVLSTGLPRSRLARFQAVEYLRGMLMGRLGWNLVDSLFIISGALGLFSRRAVLAVGGYRTDTLGEDMELVMRMQRWSNRHDRRRSVRFVGAATSWTEVPESVAQLARQRARWHQGLAESLWLNRELLVGSHLAPRHRLAFAAQVLVELLGPLAELLGLAYCGLLIVTGRAQTAFVPAYFALFILGGTITSLLGIGLESVANPRYLRSRDMASLALHALLENFGYRQMTAWWRAQGLWNAARRRHRWGSMARRGHDPGAGATVETAVRRAA